MTKGCTSALKQKLREARRRPLARKAARDNSFSYRDVATAHKFARAGPGTPSVAAVVVSSCFSDETRPASEVWAGAFGAS